jgi:hypothetical protein
VSCPAAGRDDKLMIMTRDRVGRLVGAGFGLVFVATNAGSLPAAAAGPLRAAAVAAFVWVAVLARRPGSPPPGGPSAARAGFGRRYWYVVAAEGIALAAGLVVLNPVLHAPEAGVGWIALVVGVHFFGLAVAWHAPALRLLGASITVCGLAGLALAAAGVSPAVTAAVSGVLPGALLLASVGAPSLWGAPRAVRP